MQKFLPNKLNLVKCLTSGRRSLINGLERNGCRMPCHAPGYANNNGGGAVKGGAPSLSRAIHLLCCC